MPFVKRSLSDLKRAIAFVRYQPNTLNTMTMTQTPTLVQLKNLETAGGEETLRFRASLYFANKKVAIVSNDGTGGGHRYDFPKHGDHGAFSSYVKTFHTLTLEPKNPLHFFLLNYIKAMLDVCPKFNQTNINNDMVIDGLIKVFQLRKECKRKTLFRLPEAENWLVVSSPFDETLKQWLIKEYGETVIILNEQLD